MTAWSDMGSRLSELSVVIVCGAGGVGKTTTAAALGIASAQSGRRVLVLTIDPARRLASAMGLQAVGNRATEVVAPAKAKWADGGRLHVAMLDTSASWDDLVRRHAPDSATRDKILANPLYRNITQRFVQSHDYIAVERLFELHESNEYDLIVVDTPPSRHAIDFLDAPERMHEFFTSSLLRWITMPYRLGGERVGRVGYLAAKPFYQVADKILGSQFLRDVAEFFLLFQGMYDGFVQRAEAVTALLSHPSSGFVVVSTPDVAPAREADYFLAELDRRSLNLVAAVLNRVHPLAIGRLDDDAPLAAQSMALAVSLLNQTAPAAEAKSSADARILRAAAEAHLVEIAEAERQRRVWQRFGSNGPSSLSSTQRVATVDVAESPTNLLELTRLGNDMFTYQYGGGLKTANGVPSRGGRSGSARRVAEVKVRLEDR